MLLKEAIKIHTINNEHNPNYTDADREKAHQLVLEALKRLQELRLYEGINPNALLPGETEE